MPISMADAKRHLHIDGNDEDAYIAGLILAAEGHIEKQTKIVTRKRAETFLFDCFGAELAIPRGPVDPATIVVKYLDADGVEQTLAAAGYRLLTRRLVTRLLPPATGTFPPTRGVAGAVTVTAQVGYVPVTEEVPSACADGLKHAARLIVGHWFATREAVNIGNIVSPVPLTAADLLEDERLVIGAFA